MAFRGNSSGLPPALPGHNENSFRLDEGYSEDTRPQPWTDSSLRSMADHPTDLVLPESITSLPEPQRSELAYVILRSLRTSSIADIVERLTPLLHLNPVNYLPLELILQIFTYLDPETLLRASVISRTWRERALDTRLWQGLYHREGWRADLDAISRFQKDLATKALTKNQRPGSRKAAVRAPEGWANQNDAVEADDQMMEDPSSQTAVAEDAVMQDIDDANQPRSKSIFGIGASSSAAAQDTGSADEDEMYPSPPIPRQPIESSGQGSTPPGDASPIVRQDLIASSSALSAPKVNWQYLYKQRKRLEKNWSNGRFINFQLPHPDYAHEGHRECIYTIQYSGKYLVSGSRDQSVRIWDLDTRRLVREPLVGHRMSVLCLQFDASPEEDIIISGSSDTDVVLWRFSTGEIIQRIKRAHRESVLNLRFDKRYLITCSRDKTIRVWSRKELQVGSKDFPKPSQPWGSEPGKFPAHIIDMMRQPSLVPQPLPPYSLLMTLAGHGAAVNAIQIHGDKIVSASGDRSIRVWDAVSGDVIRTIAAHTKGIACVQFDGKRIVSGSSDWTVRIFDCETAAEIGHLQGHNHLVRTVQAGFGDVPGSTEEDLKEARSLDRELLTGIYEETLPDFHARTHGKRNAGSKATEKMTAWGASLPPGGGGSKWGRIVSGSYDETVIIWKRDRHGNWIVGHRLRQEDAARNASGQQQQVVADAASAAGANAAAAVTPAAQQAAQHALLASFNQTIAQIQAGQTNNAQAPGVPSQAPQAAGNQAGPILPPAGPQQIVSPALAAAAAAAVNVPNGGAGPAANGTPLAAPIAAFQAAQLPPTSNNTNPPQQAPPFQPPLLPQPQVQYPQTAAGAAAAAIPATAPPPAAAAAAPPAAAGAATQPAAAGSGNSRVFKLQFDARRIICCSQDPRIVGWDFANGDPEIEEVSQFFLGC